MRQLFEALFYGLEEVGPSSLRSIPLNLSKCLLGGCLDDPGDSRICIVDRLGAFGAQKAVLLDILSHPF